MKKILKQYGTTLIINLNKEDREIYGLRKGDLVDIEITKIKGGNKNGKSKT